MTACDISPVVIEIARENAELIGLPVTLEVTDAQTLDPIAEESFDIVYASYLMWFEDVRLACENWYRVLRPGGKLLINAWHPVTYCLEDIDGRIVPQRNYNDLAPDHREFDGTNIDRQHGGWGIASQSLSSTTHWPRS